MVLQKFGGWGADGIAEGRRWVCGGCRGADRSKAHVEKNGNVRWHCGNLGGQVLGVGELTGQKYLS